MARQMKLTAAEWQQYQELREDVVEKQSDVNGALEDIRVTVQETYEAEVKDKVDALQDAVRLLEEFLNEKASELREAHWEKSETWQESDKGESADAWISDIENHGLDADADVSTPTFKLYVDDFDLSLPDIEQGPNG